jgi:2-hydroxy-3-keto-5-methylthiopentenyl-1-phosphate phosphatase
VRSRIERNLKEFYKKNQHVKPKEECKYQVFSTQASDNDPTILTEDEYTEIIVSDVMKTPFHDFLHEQLESINTKKNLVLSFMAYIKSNEPEIISAFNETFYINKEFYKHLTLKNR